MNLLDEKSKQSKKRDDDIFNKFVPLNHNILRNYPNLQKDENKEVYIFDIDKTLYPSYLVEKCTKKKMMYLQYLMSIGYTTQQACKILMTLRNKYNKIIQGLLEEYELNDHHYNRLIQYDPTKYMNLCSDFDAIGLFSNLEGLKVCFTNACGKHSKFVLEKLGIIDHIDYIFHCDLENKVFNCKPSKEVYQMVEEYLQVKDKNKIHFFDDKLVNVETAKEIGWNAYHVNDDLTYKNILRTYLIENGKLHVE